MSYASDHLAWQQRVGKEVCSAKNFSETFIPMIHDSDSPLKGLVNKYASKYSFADPNSISKYDLKNAVSKLELTNVQKKNFALTRHRNSMSNLHDANNTSDMYKSSSHIIHSPIKLEKRAPGLNLQPGMKHEDLKLMLSKASSNDIFTTDRFPRPKPFFHQAYIAKSQADSASQMGRARSIGKLGKIHYPQGHPNHKAAPKLPNIKAQRFNEAEGGEYSVFGKSKSKRNLAGVPAVGGATKLVPAGDLKRRIDKFDGSHLSQVSNRADELKRMIEDVDDMISEKERHTMQNALKSKQLANGKSKVKNLLIIYCYALLNSSLI